MIRVEVVEDVGRFEALRPEWDALLAASAAPHVFLSWEWLFAWWAHLRGRRRLHLLAVRRGGELVGLAPLALRPGPIGWALPRLDLLGTGVVGSDYLDFIVRPDAAAEVRAALVDHLASRRAVMDLRQLPAQGSEAGQVAAALAARGWRLSQREGDVCPFTSLAGHTWDSYLATLPYAHRANVRKRLRKLQERGAVFERAQSEEQRQAALAALFDLHQQRWQERGGSQAFDSALVFAFHQDVTRRLLERGWLRLHVLRLDGEPAAALYGMRYGGRFYYYQAGFAPRHAALSVGLAALALGVRSAIEEGAAELDLLHGGEPYKFLWAREVRGLARLEADPPGVAARTVRSLVEASLGARQGALRLARRLLPAPLAARLGRRELLRSSHAASLG
jgi:CelD/BcsL family acetyltransferase involved in cellulose biosynthesis